MPTRPAYTIGSHTLSYGGFLLREADPPGIPQYTVRFEFPDGYDPHTAPWIWNDPDSRITWKTGSSWAQVSSSPNVWDYTHETASWDAEFYDSTHSGSCLFNPLAPVKVLGCNLSGVSSAFSLFSNAQGLREATLDFTGYTGVYLNSVLYQCENLVTADVTLSDSVRYAQSLLAKSDSLESFSLHNTSRVLSFYGLAAVSTGDRWSLKSVPLFDTSSATDVASMFSGQRNVEGGALALYTQMSTQANPPSSHSYCFNNCGADTASGAAELAQIPSSWGGTGA